MNSMEATKPKPPQSRKQRIAERTMALLLTLSSGWPVPQRVDRQPNPEIQAAAQAKRERKQARNISIELKRRAQC